MVGRKNNSTRLKKATSRGRGFTIIEVMIVLAVGGLILIIVMRAVPAFQRASRNQGRKEDAGRLYAALNSYLSEHRELTLSAGPNQVLLHTGRIIGSHGEAGKLAYINNECPVDTGTELSGAYAPAGDAIGNRSESCADGTSDEQGVYIFREVQTGFHNSLGPYLNSGSPYGPDTIHLMLGAKCDVWKPGDPAGSNYAYFVEMNDIHYLAVAFAFESGGLPEVHCNDYTL